MPQIDLPLLVGSRPIVVTVPEQGIALPPPVGPEQRVADVVAAVRDALRFPLAGPSLEQLVTGRARRATIVVELPTLPIPGSAHDPRQDALVAACDELERLGIPTGYQTILVSAGLGVRPSKRDIAALVTPEFARRFHGLVLAHDVEDGELITLGEVEGTPLQAARVLLETDVVVCVSAAETVVSGGPGTLLSAGGAGALRAAAAGSSLLETSGASGWRFGLAFVRALEQQTAVIGVSLALSTPRLGGVAAGYPQEARAVGRIARSPLRRVLAAVPRNVRWQLFHAVPVEIGATAVFAGPPEVAHAEALLATIEARALDVERPFDVLVVPVPDITLTVPRQRPNPLAAAALGLGHVLRLWRGSPPLVEGGTIVLLHGLERRFANPSQAPYRGFLTASRGPRDQSALAALELLAARDQRAIRLYQHGGSCHPLSPFADWQACQAVVERAGEIVAAPCRDAVVARQLGFIPSHSVPAALALAAGRIGRPPQVGFVLGPPYPYLRVS